MALILLSAVHQITNPKIKKETIHPNMKEITIKEEVSHSEIEKEVEGSIATAIIDVSVKYVKILSHSKQVLFQV